MTDARIELLAHTPAASTDRLIQALDAVQPVITAGSAAGPARLRAAAALYSLLARLFPHTELSGDGDLGPNPWGITRLAALPAVLHGVCPAATYPATATVPVAFGETHPAAQLYVGGDDWTACVGRTAQTVVDGPIGLGLQAAAAYAAAEVTKLVLGPLGLAHVPLGAALVWNLLDYRGTVAPPLPPSSWQSRPVVLCGAGSVGSSVGGLLACLPTLAGTIDVIDPDTFDPARNPTRYPASTGTTSGAKAAWVAAMLRDAGWTAHPLDGAVADWIDRQPVPGFDGLLVSSVDDLAGRRDVADVLARETISLGVAGLGVRLVRTYATPDGPCPYCQFVDVTPPLLEAQLIADHTGLAVDRVIQLQLSGGPLEERDVQAALAAGAITPDRAHGLIGRRLADLRRRAYSQATVRTAQGEVAQVSTPFVSWIAGVLGAAEVSKSLLGLPTLAGRIDLDLAGLPAGYTTPAQRDPSRRCLCWSPVRRRWLRRLYPR